METTVEEPKSGNGYCLQSPPSEVLSGKQIVLDQD